MLEDPEELTDELIQESALFAMNLRAGFLDSATPAIINAWMRDHAQTAERLATAYQEEVRRRRHLEEEAKSGLYLQGAHAMGDALVRSEHNAKQSRYWLDAASIQKRATEARQAYDRASYFKLGLAGGIAAAVLVFGLYALRRAAFYSLASSVLLWAAAGLVLAALGTWFDLSRRQKTSLAEARHWFELSASEAQRAREVAGKRDAYWELVHARETESGEDELEDEDEDEDEGQG